MPALSTRLTDPDAIPYFLWDDPMTVSELEERLRTASEPEQLRLRALILREARDPDVWRFVSPEEIVRLWPQLAGRLGVRRGFWEFLLARWKRLGHIDLVRSRAPQIHPEKLDRDGVLVDPAAEILANKLCTLLSRGEVRGLVDVLSLERSGLRVEDALVPASSKDGGLTPAQLAWVLSQITVGSDARIPAGVTPVELRTFLEDLVSRLTRLAYPGTAPL